jgi:argininosuccinate synthase
MLESVNYKKVASYEKDPIQGDNVILGYSGGLDSSVILKVLIEKYKVNVYAVCVNIGQREDLEYIRNKAIEIGAKDCFIVDAIEEYASTILTEAIHFNADYEDGYHMFCPLGRIQIAKVLVEYAKKYNCTTIVHAATGKGNDQIRFDNYITTLDPSLKILAPVREWSMGREAEIEYAQQHNIPVTASLEKIYSYDENLWGCSAEGGEIEDFKKIPPLERILKFTSLPENAPDKPEYIKIEFNYGRPINVTEAENDFSIEPKMPMEIMETVNKIGAKHGIGITHLVEDRVLGLKVRGIYEEPGAEILIQAHKALEKAVSTREEIQFKELVDKQWSQLVYEGRYFHPLMKSLRSYLTGLSYKVDGTVTVKLYKGRAEVVAISSKYCLNNEASSFVQDGNFNQNASAGFIEHFNYTQKLTYNLDIKC